MMMDCRIAGIGDAGKLAEMNALLIRDEGHRNLMTIEQLAERMRGWLSGSWQAAWIAVDGADIGYALFKVEERGAWLRQLYVDPAWRRRGFGRQALAWLSKHAWPGARGLRIEVLAGNVESRAFWRALGFEEYSIAMEAAITQLDLGRGDSRD